MRSHTTALAALTLFLICLSCSREPDPASVKNYFNEAVKEYQKGEYRKAIAHAEAVLRIVPYYGEMYSFIGFCHINLNEVDEGVRHLKKAIEYQPYDLKALKALCELPYEGKSTAQVLDYCMRCVDIDKSYVKGYEYGILSLLKAGETQRARDMLARLNEIDRQAAAEIEKQMEPVNKDGTGD